jgi:hypothetical protein
MEQNLGELGPDAVGAGVRYPVGGREIARACGKYILNNTL